jgi:hypothetical protein
MPLPLVVIILAAAAAIAATVVVFLNWNNIIDWFRSREELKQSDKDNIAFTLQQRMEDGKYSVVQGIFDQNTNTFQDGVKYEAEDICDELKEKEELVIYN